MLNHKYISLLAIYAFLLCTTACQKESSAGKKRPPEEVKETVVPVHENTIVQVLEPDAEEIAAEVIPEVAPTPALSHGSDGNFDSDDDAQVAEAIAQEPLPPPPPLPPLPPAVVAEAEEEAFCGNGIQEVIDDEENPCPFAIYGTTMNNADNTSSLVYLDPDTGDAKYIGVITKLNRVTAIDFDPKGRLFAVGIDNSTNRSAFGLLNCYSGEVEIIGQTQIETLPTNGNGGSNIISDIDFDANGRLWAFLENQEALGSINILTGKFTPIAGPVGVAVSLGSGIASLPYPHDALYQGANDRLSIINRLTGIGRPGPALLLPTSGTINTMDGDFRDNTMYAAVAEGPVDDGPYANPGGPQAFLITIDLDSGDADFLEEDPIFGPPGLTAIAFHQVYEVCDGNENLPPHTLCDKNCGLREIRCDNGLDDDFDGLPDCFDADCDGFACDANDACSIEPTCDIQTQACVPRSQKDCSDHFDCTDDFCDSETGACSHVINNVKNVYGSCPTDGDGCLAGRCEIQVGTAQIICVATPRADIPLVFPPNTEPTGMSLDPHHLTCNDGDPCTSDGCSIGQCTHIALSEGDICAVSDNPCVENRCSAEGGCLATNLPNGPGPTTCQTGIDTGLEGFCLPGHFLCENGVQTPYCQADNSCAGINHVCGEICDDNVDNNCDSKIDCADSLCPEGTPCNDNIPCTLNDMCWGVPGMCMGSAPPENVPPAGSLETPEELCSDTIDNDCNHFTDCADKACNNVACDDNNSCTIDDRCRAGRCFGLPVPLGSENPANGNCQNEIDDDCNNLTDCDDPSCQTGAENTTELCHDNLDNNCNGLTDCEDPGCRAALAFLPEICNNTVDDNCNNLLNCADPECPNGSICAGENLCVQDSTCQDGECTDGTIIRTCSPQPANPCLEFSCNPETGDCEVVNKPDGTPLDQECTVPDVEGICIDGGLQCFDSEAVCVSLRGPVPEICFNGLDDNCNGEVDEDCPKLVFITQRRTNGQFGSVANGNAICQAEAIAAERPGTFKAWLSDGLGSSPDTTFHKATIPYALTNGLVIANNYAQLVANGSVLNYIDRDATGAVVQGDTVWTGTMPDGKANLLFTCQSWGEQGDFDIGGIVGNSGLKDNRWTNFALRSCVLLSRLYCFEQ